MRCYRVARGLRSIALVVVVILFLMTTLYTPPALSFSQSRLLAGQQHVQWGILFFIAGDYGPAGDSEAWSVVNELRAVGSTNDTKLIVFIDSYNDTAKIYIVGEKNGTQLAPLIPLESLGEVSTGDPGVLSTFLSTVFSLYSFSNVSLAIVYHRSPSSPGENILDGICYDTHPGRSSDRILTIAELASVLASYSQELTGSTLVLDVDYMLSIEVATALRATGVRYLVGSPGVTLGPLSYQQALSTFYSTANKTQEALVYSLISSSDRSSTALYDPFVITALDIASLTSSAALLQFYSDMLVYSRLYPGFIGMVDKALGDTLAYPFPLLTGAADHVSFVDMGCFLNSLYNIVSGDPRFTELATAIHNLNTTLYTARLYKVASSYYMGALGLSIYLPSPLIDYAYSRDAYKELVEGSDVSYWRIFLDRYYCIKCGDTLGLDVGTTVLLDNGGASIYLTLLVNGIPAAVGVDCSSQDIQVALLYSDGAMKPLSNASISYMGGGRYLIQVPLDSLSSSTAIVVACNTLLGRLEHCVSLEDLLFGIEVLDRLARLNASIDEVRGDIVVVNTSIGRLLVRADQIIDNISAVNKTVNKIVITMATRLNRSIVGTIVGLEKTVVTINTSIGLLRLNLSTGIRGLKEAVISMLNEINARVISIDNNVATVNTSIGILQANISDLILGIHALNSSFIEIMLRTNQTLYGAIVDVRNGTAIVRTELGDITLSILDLKDAMRTSVASVDRGVYGLQIIASFIIALIGVTWYLITAFYKRAMP